MYGYKLKQKWNQGSMAVEAVYLIPFILFVIFALLSMTFYLHDKILLQTKLNHEVAKECALLQNETVYETGKISYEKLLKRKVLYSLESLDKEKSQFQEKLEKELNQGFYLFCVDGISVTFSHTNVKVEAKCKVSFPMEAIKQYFTKTGYEVEQRVEGVVHQPAEFVRVYDVLAETLDSTKGGARIKEVLKKIADIYS